MKPPPFDYEAPTSLAEAVSLLADPERDSVVLAGGQSLMPMLNLRLARPDLLVDLRRIDGLDGIRRDGDRLVIGAMATKRAAERSALVREHHPLLHAATLEVGHPQIRNRGTVGGSFAHGDPAAEYPAVAVTVGAEMSIVGPGGARRVSAADFYHGHLTTALEEGEILTEVSLPVMEPRSGDVRSGWAFREISRRHGDFALVGISITLKLDAADRIRDARLVLFGVDDTPLRVTDAEELLDGRAPDATVLAEAARVVEAAIDGAPSDVHGSAEYRRHLAGVLTVRGLEQAVSRAVGTP